MWNSYYIYRYLFLCIIDALLVSMKFFFLFIPQFSFLWIKRIYFVIILDLIRWEPGQNAWNNSGKFFLKINPIWHTFHVVSCQWIQCKSNSDDFFYLFLFWFEIVSSIKSNYKMKQNNENVSCDYYYKRLVCELTSTMHPLFKISVAVSVITTVTRNHCYVLFS